MYIIVHYCSMCIIFPYNTVKDSLDDISPIVKNFFIFCRYIRDVVGTRALPPSAETTTPRVVMKMDIEVLIDNFNHEEKKHRCRKYRLT